MTRNRKKDWIDRYGSNMSVFGPGQFNTLLHEVHTLMDRMWNDRDLTGDAFHALQSNKSSLPKINISETDDEYEVEIAVSGFNKEDLELEFKDSCLFIKIERSSEEDNRDKKWLTREISTRSSRRVLQFPIKIDSSEIISAFNDDKSLVTCVLPKVKKTEPEVVKIKID